MQTLIAVAYFALSKLIASAEIAAAVAPEKQMQHQASVRSSALWEHKAFFSSSTQEGEL